LHGTAGIFNSIIRVRRGCELSARGHRLWAGVAIPFANRNERRARYRGGFPGLARFPFPRKTTRNEGEARRARAGGLRPQPATINHIPRANPGEACNSPAFARNSARDAEKPAARTFTGAGYTDLRFICDSVALDRALARKTLAPRMYARAHKCALGRSV